jgi:hypothetical protein
MSPVFAVTRLKSALRRVLVGFCIVAHLAVTTGFPLPESKELVAGAARFPCEKHRCGCRSAEHCWRSCCCMSAAEKLAWAKRNGVTPPDYVVDSEHDEVGRESASCCRSHRDRAEESAPCCAVARRSCCSLPAAAEPAGSAHEDQSQAPAERKYVWVDGIQAQHCQGLATIWVISGAVLPPPPPIRAPIEMAPPTWFVPRSICRWVSLSCPPDVPPPRCA